VKKSGFKSNKSKLEDYAVRGLAVAALILFGFVGYRAVDAGCFVISSP
jgi:hypothetical protein